MSNSHYFVNDANLASKPRLVKFNVDNIEFAFESDIGVFSKNELDFGSRLLIETLLPIDLGKSILDIGCGIGPIGLTLAYFKKDLKVLCSDVNMRALSLCEANARKLSLSQRVTCLQSDIYLEIEGLYDSIVSNPPIRAGKKITYAIYTGAKSHLIDGGSLYVVVRKEQGALSVKSFLEETFGNVEVLSRKKGYYILKSTKVN